jgi:hypothetical protein
MKKASARPLQTHHREGAGHRAAAQGFAAALLENLKYDETGNLLTTTFSGEKQMKWRWDSVAVGLLRLP